jgi:hypothetical protein
VVLKLHTSWRLELPVKKLIVQVPLHYSLFARGFVESIPDERLALLLECDQQAFSDEASV